MPNRFWITAPCKLKAEEEIRIAPAPCSGRSHAVATFKVLPIKRYPQLLVLSSKCIGILNVVTKQFPGSKTDLDNDIMISPYSVSVPILVAKNTMQWNMPNYLFLEARLCVDAHM